MPTVKLSLNPDTGQMDGELVKGADGEDLQKNIFTSLPIIPAVGGLAIAGVGDVVSGLIVEAIFPPANPDADPPILDPDETTKNLTDAGILFGLSVLPQLAPIKRINPGIANASSVILLADAIAKVVDVRGLISDAFSPPDPTPASVKNRFVLAFGRRGRSANSLARVGRRGNILTSRQVAGRQELQTAEVRTIQGRGGRIVGNGSFLGAPTHPNIPVLRESRAALGGF